MRKSLLSIMLGALAAIAALTLGRTTVMAASPVTHLGPDGVWQFAIPLQESGSVSIWLHIYHSAGRGDIFRTNPDGTLFLHTTATGNNADVYVVKWDTTDPDHWVPLEVFNGPGNFYSTYTAVVTSDGWIQWDGKRLEWRVAADLRQVLPAPAATEDEVFLFEFQRVARDWEDVLFKISFEPYGWDEMGH